MGCFEQKSYIHSRGPVLALCNAIQSLPVRTGPVTFNSCIISLRARTGLQISNSLWTAHFRTIRGLCGPCSTGPVCPHMMSVRDFCKFWLSQFPYMSVWVPYSTFAGPTWAVDGSCRIWKMLEFPIRGPYDTCMGTARGPCGVLRIMLSNHKSIAVPSCTGPIAWCDHEHRTGVKFLRVLHLALQARNHMGAKNVRVP